MVKLDNFPVFSSKKWKTPLFQIIFSKFLCSPFGLQIPLFCSKTSLYILKLTVRMKKKSKKNYGTLLTTASNHCARVGKLNEKHFSTTDEPWEAFDFLLQTWAERKRLGC
jgi:hypothetical protein